MQCTTTSQEEITGIVISPGAEEDILALTTNTDSTLAVAKEVAHNTILIHCRKGRNNNARE